MPAKRRFPFRAPAVFVAALAVSTALLASGYDRTAAARPGATVPIPPAGGSMLESAWVEATEAHLGQSEVDAPLLAVRSGEGDRREAYVIVDHEPDSELFSDELEYLGGDVARSGVRSSEIPDDLRRWSDRSLEVYDTDGESCPAQVGELYGLARPGDTHSYLWAPGSRAVDEMSDDQLAREAWEHRSASPMLIGSLDVEESCELGELLWAHPVEQSSSVVESTSANDRLRADVLELFRASSEYDRIQERYADQWDDDAEDWSQYQGASPEVTVYDGPSPNIQFALVTAQAGPGCGDFYGRLWKLYAVYSWGDRVQFAELDGGSDHIDPMAMVEYGGEEDGGVGRFALVYDSVRADKHRHIATDIGGVEPREQQFMLFAIRCRC